MHIKMQPRPTSWHMVFLKLQFSRKFLVVEEPNGASPQKLINGSCPKEELQQNF
jgi:hypothetical protein